MQRPDEMAQCPGDYGHNWIKAIDTIYRGDYNDVECVIDEYFAPGVVKNKSGVHPKRDVIRIKTRSGKLWMFEVSSTNKNIGTRMFGDPPGKSWVGKEIVLQARIVIGPGNHPVPGLRILPINCQIYKSERAKWLGLKASLKKYYRVGGKKGSYKVEECSPEQAGV